MNMLAVIGIVTLTGVAFIAGYIVNLKELIKLKKTCRVRKRIIKKQSDRIAMKNYQLGKIHEYAKFNTHDGTSLMIKRFNNIKELVKTAINY